MSLILDALKKSENDRKRSSSPVIADIRVASEPPAAPTWLRWLIGLLAINLLVLLIVILRPAQTTSDSAGTLSAPVSVANVEAATTQQQYAKVERAPIRAKEEVRSLSREVTISEQGPGREGTTRKRPATVAPAPGSAPAEPPQRALAEDSGLTDPSLPRYEALFANGSLDIPKLHIDLHFYHPEAQRRLVYINSHKYTEGETIEEGPRINDIRPDGASLNYRGTDFFLPRD